MGKSSVPMLMLLGALVSCSAQNNAPTCPADITHTLEPRVVSLAVGETATPKLRVFTCAGTIEETVSPVWISMNSEVASVNGQSGTILGRAPGETRVRVTEQKSLTDDYVKVTVTSPQ